MKDTGIYILLFTACLVNGCALHNIKNTSGVYQNQWHDTEHQLKLASDGNFIFCIKEGLLKDTIEGKWEIKGKRIFLIANEYKSSYIVNDCKSCDGYKMTTFDSETKKVITVFYKVFYNDFLKNEGYTNEFGNATIIDDIDSIYVESLEYKPFAFKIKPDKSSVDIFLSKTKNYEILQYKWYLKPNEIRCSNGLSLKQFIGESSASGTPHKE